MQYDNIELFKNPSEYEKGIISDTTFYEQTQQNTYSLIYDTQRYHIDKILDRIFENVKKRNNTDEWMAFSGNHTVIILNNFNE